MKLNIDQIPNDRKALRPWVIYQLSLKGLTLADVARSNGVNRQAIYKAFYRPYPRSERAIAKHLDVPVENLWPERYEGKNALPTTKCRSFKPRAK